MHGEGEGRAHEDAQIAESHFAVAGHAHGVFIRQAVAQRILSTPGKRDGLYWESADGEEASPTGEMIAAAHDRGFTKAKKKSGEPQPYDGYFFRVLSAQGPAAPGGRYNYVINGHLIGGFGLIAFPAQWGKSGVMSFIVNQQGKVFQKDLGPKTTDVARAITEYNPDKTWSPAKFEVSEVASDTTATPAKSDKK